MFTELPVDLIDCNPYNSRSGYSSTTIERLARSIGQNGQLAPIKVRPSRENKLNYQLIYGHRRFLAAKRLGWKSIRAEVVEATDEEMITESLVENSERDDLSDFDKALVFERLSKEFGKSYEQIARLAGISKSHVCNYLGMLRLFDSDTLSKYPELKEVLQSLTERHGRILNRIGDKDARINLARMVVRDKMSIRDLSNMAQRLRSWFDLGDDSSATANEKATENENKKEVESQLLRILANEFSLPHHGDFESFKKMHLFDEGFSLFGAFPPFERVENREALSKERNWFYNIGPHLSYQIVSPKFTFMGHVVLATMIIKYSGNLAGNSVNMHARGTVLFVRTDGVWRIIHEHWSRSETPIKNITVMKAVSI